VKLYRISSLGILAAIACSSAAGRASSPRLRVVIVRHGEKPDSGDQLTCQGQNRALKLPAVLVGKFGKPDVAYVPALGLGTSTSHARMFQTVAPLAIKYNLGINTKFDEGDAAGVAADVMARTGTVLLVWEHSAIPDVARKLGIADPPKWKGKDFDSIWVIDFTDGGASLTVDHEGLSPSADCSY
jgi:hypothetical protein